MGGVGNIIAAILWLYFVILLARFIIDLIQMLSREWAPHGVVLLLAEAIYTVTDPPLKALRKIIPPLKLGGIALDLSFLVLIILIQIGIQVAVTL